MEVSKKDWKLFRERLPGWQEHYMEKLKQEYIALLNNMQDSPSSRFWALDKRIREDKRSPGVRLELRKQTVIYDIVHMLADNVITMDDLKDFSEETQDAVRHIWKGIS